ncbi:MAG TPA: hypothetical protein VIG33_14815 [Pseudobdellovibrionaceae bacterium]|jgi:hypothetical protein
MKQITENTLIPISLVMTLLGGAAWLTAVWYDTKANAVSITEIKSEQKILAKDLVEMQKKTIEDLATIKVKLNIKSQQ